MEDNGINVLILLVGSNPLPNFVTVKYLLDDKRADKNLVPVPGKICLLCSKDTLGIAKSIKNLLPVEPADVIIKSVGEKQREAGRIIEALKETVGGCSSSSELSSLHINITGGTKPMAVFSTLQGAGLIDHANLYISDIDPERYMLRVYRDDEEFYLPNPFSKNGLLDYPGLQMKINDIIRLHDMMVHNYGTQTRFTFAESDYDNTVHCDLLRCFTPGFNTIINDINGISIYEKSSHAKNNTAKSKLNKKFGEDKNFIDKFRNAFPSLIKYVDENKRCLKDEVARPYMLLKLLQGGWLEDLVSQTVLSLKKSGEIKISDISKGMEVEYKNRTAELDVLFMKGYQMFLASCTSSSNIGTVKQKAFEAIYRAEQLGGEHSKVIVVSTMYNNPVSSSDYRSIGNNISELEKDLSQFDARKKVNLIGLNEIKGELDGKKSLSIALKQIIEGV